MIHGRSGSIYGQGESAEDEAKIVLKVAHAKGWIPERTLGQGAFGTVHLVQDPKTHQLRALKVVDMDRLTADPSKSESLIQKQKLELDVQMSTSHPNIVRMLEWFTAASSTRSYLFMVLEFCDGGHLLTHTQNRASKGVLLEQSTLIRWFIEILIAMRHLHCRNILHRDLKPDNLLLHGPASSVKVMDFGLAKKLDETLAHTRCGTPYYVPPELASGEGVDGRADIWAIGVIFYELIAGYRPFEGGNLVELFTQIRGFEPAQLSSTSSDLRIRALFLPSDDGPAKFDDVFGGIIMSMLQKSRQDRPSADDLLAHPYIVRAASKGVAELTHILQKQKAASATVAAAIPVPAPPSEAESSALHLPAIVRSEPSTPTKVSRRGTPVVSQQDVLMPPPSPGLCPPATPERVKPLSTAAPDSATKRRHSPRVGAGNADAKAEMTPSKRPMQSKSSVRQDLAPDSNPVQDLYRNFLVKCNSSRATLLRNEYHDRLAIIAAAAAERSRLQKKKVDLRPQNDPQSIRDRERQGDAFAGARRVARMAAASNPLAGTTALIDVARGIEAMLEIANA